MICAVFSDNQIGNFQEVYQIPDNPHLFKYCYDMVVYQQQKKFIERQNLMTGEWEKPDVFII